MDVRGAAGFAPHINAVTEVSPRAHPSALTLPVGEYRVVTNQAENVPTRRAPGLKRTLSLGHATLYGLGVTIGAGIYVLIGAAAAHSAMYAPAAFAVAALLMALTAGSFAELVARAPVAAGEAAYVALAFRSDRLATAVGPEGGGQNKRSIAHRTAPSSRRRPITSPP